MKKYKFEANGNKLTTLFYKKSEQKIYNCAVLHDREALHKKHGGHHHSSGTGLSGGGKFFKETYDLVEVGFYRTDAGLVQHPGKPLKKGLFLYVPVQNMREYGQTTEARFTIKGWCYLTDGSNVRPVTLDEIDQTVLYWEEAVRDCTDVIKVSQTYYDIDEEKTDVYKFLGKKEQQPQKGFVRFTNLDEKGIKNHRTLNHQGWQWLTANYYYKADQVICLDERGYQVTKPQALTKEGLLLKKEAGRGIARRTVSRRRLTPRKKHVTRDESLIKEERFSFFFKTEELIALTEHEAVKALLEKKELLEKLLNDHPCYEWEYEGQFVQEEVLEQLKNKLIFDAEWRLKRWEQQLSEEAERQKIMDFMLTADIPLTSQHSFDTGNCEEGTLEFMRQYKLQEGVSTKVLARHKKIAEMLDNKQFVRVIAALMSKGE